MMATQVPEKELDVQEQVARIRQMIEASDRNREDIERIRAETRQQEAQTRYEPLKLLIGAMTAGAALVGATIAVTKLFL